MKVEYTSEAARLAEAIQEWWIANRDKNPDLFSDELDRANAALTYLPKRRKVHRVINGIEVRRFALKKTQHHLYYHVIDDEEVVRVIAVWGMPKKGEPDLGELLSAES